MARRMMSEVLPDDVHFSMFVPNIQSMCSEEQQAHWLPRIEAGEVVGMAGGAGGGAGEGEAGELVGARGGSAGGLGPRGEGGGAGGGGGGLRDREPRVGRNRQLCKPLHVSTARRRCQ